jgi:hypothetical protein
MPTEYSERLRKESEIREILVEPMERTREWLRVFDKEQRRRSRRLKRFIFIGDRYGTPSFVAPGQIDANERDPWRYLYWLPSWTDPAGEYVAPSTFGYSAWVALFEGWESLSTLRKSGYYLSHSGPNAVLLQRVRITVLEDRRAALLAEFPKLPRSRYETYAVDADGWDEFLTDLRAADDGWPVPEPPRRRRWW